MRILLCLVLCMVLSSCMGCGQECIEYQDVAGVEYKELIYTNPHVDSVVMIVNDSITGCGSPHRTMVGSKTHHVKFPTNIRVQLFSQGDLWKEFFFEMGKNTVVKIYKKVDCSESNSPFSFIRSVESAKEHNRFIDSSLTDDYCWLLEKMGDSYDYERCTEYSVDGKQELCGKL
jgi:hypothetical protein